MKKQTRIILPNKEVQINDNKHFFTLLLEQDKMKLKLFVFGNTLDQNRFYTSQLELRNVVGKNDSLELMSGILQCFQRNNSVEIDLNKGEITLCLPPTQQNQRVLFIKFKLNEQQPTISEIINMELKKQEMKMLAIEETNKGIINKLINKVMYLKKIVKQQKKTQQQFVEQLYRKIVHLDEQEIVNPKKKINHGNLYKQKQINIEIKQYDQCKIIDKESDEKQTQKKQQIQNNDQKQGNSDSEKLSKRRQHIFERKWMVGTVNIQKFMLSELMVKYLGEFFWSQICMNVKISKLCLQKFQIKIILSKEGKIIIGVISKKVCNKNSSFSSGLAIGYQGDDKCIVFANKLEVMGDGFKENDVVQVEVNWNSKMIQWSVNSSVLAQKTLGVLQNEQLYPYVQMYHKDDIVEWIE